MRAQAAEVQRESEERFRLMIYASPVAMLMTDAAGRIMLVNARTEQPFGHPRAELEGQSIEMLVPERLRGRHSGIRRGFTSHAHARPIGAGRDLLGLRKDGTEFPFEIDLSPVATKEGLFMLSSMVDITERKRAEEHRDLLTRELAYRVKNTPAVVQSIASQTLRDARSLQQFSESFKGRLGALAAAHDLLLSEVGGNDVELRELLMRTLEPIVPSKRVELDGPAVALPAAAAVSLGMAVHELATNASKYGAFSALEGRVQVSWSVVVHDSERQL